MNLIRILLFAVTAATALCAAPHPLEPLTADEIALAGQLIRARDSNATFVTVALKEPSKSDVYAWQPGRAARRYAEVALLREGLHEVVVDLDGKEIVKWVHSPEKQPLQTEKDYKAITDLVRADPQWRRALEKRGITEFEKVYLNIWTFGNERRKGSPKQRLMRVLSNWRGEQQNVYGPSIEGLEVIVSCEPPHVLEVIDLGSRPISRQSTDIFDAEVRGNRSQKLKPLQTTQPEGASFKIEGNAVEWDNWKFRYSMNGREGLILHDIRYKDHGKERQILYRASISEMMVPYSDPSRTWSWRSAIDVGEYGLGKLACPLELGKTAPSHATLLNVTTSNETGEPIESTNRIAIYERAGDNLWSHWDYEAGVVGRRSRELVIGFIATVGNYDYGLNWIFRRDGSIEFLAELTGIMLTKGVDATHCANCQEGLKPGKSKGKADERYGTLVAPNVVAVNHQHYINLRLDFDLEGQTNAVKELNLGRESWWRNGAGNAFIAEQRVFAREKETRRRANSASHRHWAVTNPQRQTELGHFPSYLVMPSATAQPFMKSSRLPMKIAGFAEHQFFATRFNPEELHAAGAYPSQAIVPNNVLTWGDNNESIFAEDVVVWVTLGLSHIPRPEEYPVMPATTVSLKLAPKGFFNRNPALDIAEEE